MHASLTLGVTVLNDVREALRKGNLGARRSLRPFHDVLGKKNPGGGPGAAGGL